MSVNILNELLNFGFMNQITMALVEDSIDSSMAFSPWWLYHSP